MRDNMDFSYAISNYLKNKKNKMLHWPNFKYKKNNIEENEFGDISENVIIAIKRHNNFILICSRGANLSNEQTFFLIRISVKIKFFNNL